MRHTLASLVLALFLFPSIAMGVTVKYEDLVKLEGLHYYKFTGEPFTGKVTGKTQGSFKNGKRYGAWVIYHDNGQLWAKGTYKNDKRDGPWVFYYKNGQLESKGTFKDGKRDGAWVIYYDNGQLLIKGTYKDGKKNGPWVGYKKDGTVEGYFTGTYKNGVKVK